MNHKYIICRHKCSNTSGFFWVKMIKRHERIINSQILKALENGRTVLTCTFDELLSEINNFSNCQMYPIGIRIK